MAKKTKKKSNHLLRKLFIAVIALVSMIATYEYNRESLYALVDSVRVHIEQLATPAIPAISSCTDGEIPAPLRGVSEQIIRHEGYTVSYNSTWKIPNWVAYELTASEAIGKSKRKDNFVADPTIGNTNNLKSSYYKSGYDRGHMAPAADMAWSDEVMAQSFYYTNMCPQHPTLNRGLWSNLEEQVRLWAIADSAIYVVTGVVVDNKQELNTIGNEGVVVPNYLYKAVVSPFVSPPRAIAFVMKNEKSNPTLVGCAISVDSLEAFANIDLFPTLPDDIENAIEATFVSDAWHWK